MGCDIHLFGERKVNGVWEPIRGENSNASFWREKVELHTKELETGNIPARYTEEELWQEIAWCQNQLNYYTKQGDVLNCLYSDRNYDVFAMLADVRNGRGFAGVSTGEGFNPISEPKGLPEDVTEEIKHESDEWGEDGHSHSWLTLRELLDYDWNQGTVHYGTVDENEYKVFKKQGQPDGWCGGVGGRSVVHLTNEQMDSLIENDCYIADKTVHAAYEVQCVERGEPYDATEDKGIQQRESDKNYYTRVEWKSTYMDSAQHFYDAVVPKLQELSGGESDAVRIVFWFDN